MYLTTLRTCSVKFCSCFFGTSEVLGGGGHMSLVGGTDSAIVAQNTTQKSIKTMEMDFCVVFCGCTDTEQSASNILYSLFSFFCKDMFWCWGWPMSSTNNWNINRLGAFSK
jgi:hypothetical protein